MKLKKILIPTDFSDRSKSAMKIAGFLAEKYKSKIDLIHIVPLSMYMGESMDKLGLPFDMEKDLYPKLLENAKADLDRLFEEYVKERNRGKVHVMVDRKPSNAISNFADTNDFDLILMSAKGSHGTSFLRGSTADRIIQKSHVPVFTVNNKHNKSGFERIVTAIDVSEYSLASIPLSIELAYQFGASLELLYINELYSSEGYGFVAPTVGITNEAGNELFKTRVKEYFNSHKNFGLSLQEKGEMYQYRIIKNDGASSISVPVHLKIIQGISAAHEITKYANDSADLLIMTTHGRTGIAKFFMGSTAGHVVKHVDASMLTIRPDNYKLD
jgi:nucleotide-binding universal stress UspA family protein